MFLNEMENFFLENEIFDHKESNGTLFVKNKTDKEFILDVFIPGIGMNHKVFFFTFFLLKSKYKDATHNLLSLSLKGFNPYLITDHQSDNISLTEDAHVKDAVFRIQQIINTNKIKTVNLFGFSYGADILYKIGQGLIDTKIKKMVFSDINLDKQTAFLTGQIAAIENDKIFINEINNIVRNEIVKNKNTKYDQLTQKLKKTEFIKKVLLNSNTDEKVLDNLEYFRSSYQVDWKQMIESSKTAFDEASERINETKEFLTRNKICSKFIISTRTIKDPRGKDINNGYFSIIENQLQNLQGVSLFNIKNHFDGISYKILEKEVYRYFTTNSSN